MLARMARKVPFGKPTPSSALMTFAPGTAGILLGANEQITRDQATFSVNVISSGIPTSSMRSSRPARRSASAASSVGPSPNAATPGRSWAEAHQTPSSSCSTT
jgi:hypothetical protein